MSFRYRAKATQAAAQSGSLGPRALGVVALASVVIALALGLTTLGLGSDAMRLLVVGLGGVVLVAAVMSVELAVYGLVVAGAIDGLVKGFSPGYYGLLFKDIALWLVILGWVFRGINSGRLRSLGHPVALPMALFALYCFAEVFNGTTLQLTVALAGLRTWIMWLPLAFVAYDLFTDRLQIERFLLLIVLCAVPSSLYGAYQYNRGYSHLKDLSPNFSYVDKFAAGDSVRAMSTFSHPGMFGATMAMAALLMIGGVLFTRRGATWRAILLFAGGLCVLGMAASGGRTPVFGLAAAALVMMVMLRGARAVPVFVAASLVSVFVVGHLLSSSDRLRISHVPVDRESVVGRVSAPFYAGLAQALDRPFGSGVATGIGVGRGAALVGGDVNISSEANSWVENEYGRVLKELGVPGFILYCWLIASCLKWCWHSFRHLRLPGYRGWGAALFATIISGLVMQASGSTLYQAPSGPIFWICCGMLLKLSQIEANERLADTAYGVQAARLASAGSTPAGGPPAAGTSDPALQPQGVH